MAVVVDHLVLSGALHGLGPGVGVFADALHDDGRDYPVAAHKTFLAARAHIVRNASSQGCDFCVHFQGASCEVNKGAVQRDIFALNVGVFFALGNVKAIPGATRVRADARHDLDLSQSIVAGKDSATLRASIWPGAYGDFSPILHRANVSHFC